MKAATAVPRSSAYGREFHGNRPYGLEELARHAGYSPSGVRTAYSQAEVRQVAVQMGREPNRPRHAAGDGREPVTRHHGARVGRRAALVGEGRAAGGEAAGADRDQVLEDTLPDVPSHLRPQGNPHWKLNTCRRRCGAGGAVTVNYYAFGPFSGGLPDGEGLRIGHLPALHLPRTPQALTTLTDGLTLINRPGTRSATRWDAT